MTCTLHGTPLSHFTRKVRILLLELGVPFELVRPRDLLATEAAGYGNNPLMRVPTLVHGDEAGAVTLLDSDHIARFLTARYDPADRFGVRGDDPAEQNRLAVVNGIMANEVVLILAQRGGVADVASITYFRKLRLAIEEALAWLEHAIEPDAEALRYADIAMICMWQHVVHYRLLPDLERYARIAARVRRFESRPSVAATTPAASLAEATAAGWSPA